MVFAPVKFDRDIKLGLVDPVYDMEVKPYDIEVRVHISLEYGKG